MDLHKTLPTHSPRFPLARPRGKRGSNVQNFWDKKRVGEAGSRLRAAGAKVLNF